MNREMPLYALQKGSVFMSEKTSGMLAHPNTSAASTDGLRKARAAYEACFCHIFLPHKFKPLISIRAVGSISCVNARTHLPAPCPDTFLVILLYPFRDTCSSQNQRTGSQNFHCLDYLKQTLENNNLNQFFYLKSSGLVIIPLWML